MLYKVVLTFEPVGEIHGVIILMKATEQQFCRTVYCTLNSDSFGLVNDALVNLNNSNLIEWSAIWSEIIRVILKSDERAAPVGYDFRSKLHDTKFNYLHFTTAVLKSQNSVSTNIYLTIKENE